MQSQAAVTAQRREQLILSHLPQVRLLARRAHSRCPREVALEDLVSVGTKGLIQAVNRYDPKRQLKLKTLAEHRIRGAILDYLRQLDPLSRTLRQFRRRREAVLAQLSLTADVEPCEEQVAKEMHLPLEQYRRLTRDAQADAVLSLDKTANGAVPWDTPAPNDESADNRLLWSRVEVAINRLPECERDVMRALKADVSAAEIARALHLSEGRVHQIKHQAIRRLQIMLGVARRPRP